MLYSTLPRGRAVRLAHRRRTEPGKWNRAAGRRVQSHRDAALPHLLSAAAADRRRGLGHARRADAGSLLVQAARRSQPPRNGRPDAAGELDHQIIRSGQRGEVASPAPAAACPRPGVAAPPRGATPPAAPTAPGTSCTAGSLPLISQTLPNTPKAPCSAARGATGSCRRRWRCCRNRRRGTMSAAPPCPGRAPGRVAARSGQRQA